MTPDHVWFFEEWTWSLIKQTLPNHCSAQEIEMIVKDGNGLLSITNDPSNIQGEPSDVGVTSDEFFHEMANRVNPNGYQATIWDLYVYDCMWVIGKSIDMFLKFVDSDQKLGEFLKSADSNTFFGVSGYVAFDGADPAAPQLRLDQWNNMEEYIPIAKFSKTYFDIINEIVWRSGKAPLDHTPKKEIQSLFKTKTVNKIASIIYNSGAILGILLCLFVAVINLVFRNAQVIKITSPIVNYFIICGSVMLMLCVISMSPTSVSFNRDLFVASCYLYKITFNVGFTMTFGALFAKTWRVYRAFSRQSAEKLKITDLQLVLTITGIVLFEGVLQFLDIIVYKMGYEVSQTQKDVKVVSEQAEIHTTWSALSCKSRSNMFFYTSAVFKFLLLLFGGFLAFETRNVHVEAVNDSKSIAICMYNYCFCSCVGVILTYVLNWEPTDSYSILAPLILMVALFPILLLFGPRHLAVVSGKKEDQHLSVRKKSVRTSVANTDNK